MQDKIIPAGKLFLTLPSSTPFLSAPRYNSVRKARSGKGGGAKKVYLDVLFAADTAVNALLLAACGRLTGAPRHPGRIFLGAAAGGLASAALWFAGDASPAMPLFRAAVALLVTALAFGCRSLRLTLTRACVLYAVTCALAGVIASVGGTERLLGGFSFGMVFFSGLAVCLFASLVSQFRELRGAYRTCGVTLTLGERSVTLRALLDTGHSLVDPVSNRPVLVATLASLRPLFSPALLSVLDRTGAADAPALLCALDRAGIRGFTLVPCRTVGNADGLLAAFLPDAARQDGRPLPVLVAITETELADDFDALLGTV